MTVIIIIVEQLKQKCYKCQHENYIEKKKVFWSAKIIIWK